MANIMLIALLNPWLLYIEGVSQMTAAVRRAWLTCVWRLDCRQQRGLDPHVEWPAHGSVHSAAPPLLQRRLYPVIGRVRCTHRRGTSPTQMTDTTATASTNSISNTLPYYNVCMYSRVQKKFEFSHLLCPIFRNLRVPNFSSIGQYLEVADRGYTFLQNTIA